MSVQSGLVPHGHSLSDVFAGFSLRRPSSTVMDYATLDSLRRTHPAWRLLSAEHAPLVVSFLHHSFIRPNVRTLTEPELTSLLEDHLFHLRERFGQAAFPRTARQYLETWSNDAHGWLRRYYPPDGDEASFDLAPTTERAIDWLVSLRQREFVGTESKLMTVFELLRQITNGTEPNADVRINELEKQRAQIDEHIARLRGGRVDVMDDTGIKDRFLQLATTARGLLSDFREVEQNFRTLDRDVREHIATWEGAKGDLLEEIFGERDAISDSDQGKSFRAFWDLLMSATRQEQLTAMLERVFALDAVRALEPDRRLLRIHYDWLQAGEVTQRTVARVSQQLRRYLDDQTWLENRRIIRLLRDVEHHALALRSSPPEGPFMELDDPAPELVLPMERPLFSPAYRSRITEQVVVEGAEHVAADALFDQVYVDRAALHARVRRLLQTRSQVSLSEIIHAHPLEMGLAELVTYLALAADDRSAVIDDREPTLVEWVDATNTMRRAKMPRVIFTRGARTS